MGILDEAGTELARFRSQGQGVATGLINRSEDVDRYGGPLVSQVIGDVVRRWGEQLALSRDVEQFLAASDAALAGSPGSWQAQAERVPEGREHLLYHPLRAAVHRAGEPGGGSTGTSRMS